MRPLLFAALFVASAAADASCACRCVDGQVRPICTSSMEIPPICPMAICPAPSLSMQPLPSLSMPPLGTQNCRQVQVLNPLTQRQEWRTVCQ